MLIAQITNNAPDVAQAAGALIHALFPKIDYTECVTFVGSIFLIARTLRKMVPDNMQNGKLGAVLKHAALEINPVATKQSTPAAPTLGA